LKTPKINQQSAISNQQLLALLVGRVLPAEPAELAHLEPLGRLLLVLRRAVISPLTLGARERDDVSHCLLCRGAPPPRPVPSRLTPLGFVCNDSPLGAATPRGPAPPPVPSRLTPLGLACNDSPL